VFGKLCVIILSIGAVGCVLLGYRQQRLSAVHEMVQAQRVLLRHGTELTRVRAQIAMHSSPQEIARLAALKLGPMVVLGKPGEMLDAQGRAIVQLPPELLDEGDGQSGR
jgi:hypothetical protein